ncbi:TPA: hypothetical protein JLE96_004712 [Escherichia coli]|nr:hypothetical protein [Escherichia coli]
MRHIIAVFILLSSCLASAGEGNMTVWSDNGTFDRATINFPNSAYGPNPTFPIYLLRLPRSYYRFQILCTDYFGTDPNSVTFNLTIEGDTTDTFTRPIPLSYHESTPTPMHIRNPGWLTVSGRDLDKINQGVIPGAFYQCDIVVHDVYAGVIADNWHARINYTTGMRNVSVTPDKPVRNIICNRHTQCQADVGVIVTADYDGYVELQWSPEPGVEYNDNVRGQTTLTKRIYVEKSSPTADRVIVNLLPVDNEPTHTYSVTVLASIV